MYTMSKPNEKIKYLHIWNGSNYATINAFTRLINENFEPTEHFFIVRDSRDNPQQTISHYDNVIWLAGAESEKTQRREFFRRLERAETIYWHAMGWYWTTQLRLILKPRFMKKSVWVEWGRDLYNWKRTDGLPLRRLIINNIYKRWHRGVKAQVAIFPADEEVLKKEFPIKGTVYYAEYCAATADFTDSLKPELLDDGKTHILLGHSATEACHHIRVLEALEKWKEKPIIIHIPLNYGDLDYGRQVKKRAAELFPEDKLDIIEEKMPLEDYIRFLWHIDIGIFDVDRQIALGNICRLLYMCKKIYLPEESLLYKFFTDNNTEVFPLEMLKGEFDDFIKPSQAVKPSDYIADGMDSGKIINMWKKVFEGA